MAKKTDSQEMDRVEIRLPLELKARLTAFAMLRRLDRSELAADLIKQGLDRYRSDRGKFPDPGRREDAA